MTKWLWLAIVPLILGGCKQKPWSSKSAPVPSDIRIDKDIQEWQRDKASWNPNMYELQILREIQKLNKSKGDPK